jgi:hypothetical protein
MFGAFPLGGMEILLVLFLFPLALASFAFWIWMLIHAIQNKGLSDSERIAWVLVIALLHFLGAVIYFFVGKPKSLAPAVV